MNAPRTGPLATSLPTAATASPLKPPPRHFDGFAWLTHRLSWRARLFEYALPLIERELRSTVRVPWWKRPGLWRRGFLGESHALYDFDENGKDAYLTDYERAVRSRTINGPYSVLLDDKLLFARLLGRFAEHTPQLFGVLRGRRVVATEDSGVVGDKLVDIVGALGKIVIKPTSGGGGKGVVILECRGGGDFRCNDSCATPGDIDDIAHIHEGSMVTSFVRQHHDIAELSPGTTNTIRLVTMQDNADDPFVASAVLRIGCTQSAPVDNWSNGGLSASIDCETGLVGPAATYPADDDRLVWFTAHPETGAPIAGLMLPNWRHVVTGIVAIARSLPFLRYVGWDVVVTADSFVVLEGNNFTDVNLLQIHGPLLSDPRIAAFFRRHGVLGKRPRL